MAQEPLANEGNGGWRSVEEHKIIRQPLGERFRSERGFVSLTEGGKFIPNDAEVVSATPAAYLRHER